MTSTRAAPRAFEVAFFPGRVRAHGTGESLLDGEQKARGEAHPDDEDGLDVETGELEGVLDERDGIDVVEDVRFLEPELLEGPLASGDDLAEGGEEEAEHRGAAEAPLRHAGLLGGGRAAGEEA